MKRSFLWLVPVACALLSCGERSTAVLLPSSHSIRIELPAKGWAKTIEYRSGGGEVTSLTLDGVRFELRDAAAYLLDWEALGVQGVTISPSFSYESTKPVEGAFLAVAGKSVEIRDGVLTWGDATVGSVAAGDVVIVDADGLRMGRVPVR